MRNSPNLSFGGSERGSPIAGPSLGESYSGTSPLTGLTVTNYFDHLLRRTNVSLLNAQLAVLAKTTNSFTRAALSTPGAQKSKFLSVS